MSDSQRTIDHDEIRRWVEERNGRPAHVKRTGNDGDPGLLRIDFPGGDEDSLEAISWDEFFAKFDEEELAFLYQDRKASGEPSTFNKFVRR
jgi:hypothetical protein